MRCTGQGMRELSTGLSFIIAIAFVLGLTTSLSQAATVRVPADQPTIQAGIDAAGTGDTVLVAPGIYTGAGNRDISFGGRGITLRSESGPGLTVIDCQSLGRAFILRGSVTSLCRILSVPSLFAISGLLYGRLTLNLRVGNSRVRGKIDVLRTVKIVHL